MQRELFLLYPIQLWMGQVSKQKFKWGASIFKGKVVLASVGDIDL